MLELQITWSPWFSNVIRVLVIAPMPEEKISVDSPPSRQEMTSPSAVRLGLRVRT